MRFTTSRILTLAMAASSLSLTIALLWRRERAGSRSAPSAGWTAAVSSEDDLALLERRVGNLKWDGITFERALHRLANLSGVNICPDWRSLNPIGRESYVWLNVTNPTLGQALRALHMNAPPDSLVLPDVSEISVAHGLVTVMGGYPVNRHLVTEYLNLRPLIDAMAVSSAAAAIQDGDSNYRGSIADSVEQMVINTVAPETWTVNGGDVGNFRDVSGVFIVSQTAENLREIHRLLASLDQAVHGRDFLATSKSAGAATSPAPIPRDDGTLPPPAVITVFIDIKPILVELAAGTTSTNANSASWPEWITKLICDVVEPDSWREAGGLVGSIHDLSGILAVTQTPSALSAIRKLLEDLHQAFSANDFAAAGGIGRGRDFSATSEPAGPATRPAPTTRDEGTAAPPEQPITVFINIKPLLAELAKNETPSDTESATWKERIDQVSTLIIELVEPDSWRDAGGTIGSIHDLNGILAITQTPRGVKASRRMLQDLHEALLGNGFLEVTGADRGRDSRATTEPAGPTPREDTAAQPRQPITVFVNLKPLLAELAARETASGAIRSTRLKRIDHVVKLITDVVVPDEFTGDSGTGTIREVSGILILTQTPRNLTAIRHVLADLYQASSATQPALKPAPVGK